MVGFWITADVSRRPCRVSVVTMATLIALVALFGCSEAPETPEPAGGTQTTVDAPSTSARPSTPTASVPAAPTTSDNVEQLTMERAAELARNAADQPDDVDPSDIEVWEDSWGNARRLLGDGEIFGVNDSTRVIVALVRAPITNTDLIEGAPMTTDDSYVLVWQIEPPRGLRICFGCDGTPPIETTTTTES